MKRFTFVIFIFIVSAVNAQTKDFKIPDSLEGKKFWQLRSSFYASKSKILDSIYANTYLKKGMIVNDSIKIAKGYLFLSSTAKNDIEKEILIDHSISYSKNKNNFHVPCTAYSIKAYLCKQKRQFKESLDYYLLTHKSAEKAGNIELKHITKYNIGVLKTKIGDHNEALNYFREYWSLYEENQKYEQNHLKTFFALSNAYAKNDKLDSAFYFSDLGLKYSKLYNDENQYYLFVFLEGLNKFYKRDYKATIENINEAIPYIKKYKDVNNLAVCYTYLGKAYSKLDKVNESILYFKKVDSIFNETLDLLPRSREVYKVMIDYSKKSNDYKNQLYYTDQLLKLDSILTDNYKYLNSTIYKKYETLELLEEKEKLVAIFENERKGFNKYIVISLVILATISIAFFINFYKRKKYQNKYKELIAKIKNEEDIGRSLKSSNSMKVSNNGIDQEIIDKTLRNLQHFESKEGFLDKNITLNLLAKKVDTNSRYLSKILNSHKRKTYSNYINDLRINYTVNRLKNDDKFRKYTIDIIAKESGFKSRRSFSNVFSKKTGISAAYFIENLENDSN